MKAICSWCGKDMGKRPGPGEAITHSICADCGRKMLLEAMAKREREPEDDELEPETRE
jgi:DNA-directed RNA polymerase subunit RPC12/RpoP